MHARADASCASRGAMIDRSTKKKCSGKGLTLRVPASVRKLSNFRFGALAQLVERILQTSVRGSRLDRPMKAGALGMAGAG